MLHVHNCAITLYNFYSVTHLLVTIALCHTTHLRLVIVPELLVTLIINDNRLFKRPSKPGPWNWSN